MDKETGKDKTLVVVIGPTAVGKTELSIQLAKLLCCDIISADSRQIYKEINIGTAKPSPQELAEVKHHFIDMLELDQYYSAAQYESDVLQLLDKQFKTHDYAIMVGGSMMYTDAVCKGIDDIPTVSDETREMLRLKYENDGLETLCEELRLLDPEYYKIVDTKNYKRVVHALEICYQTGKTYTSFRTKTIKERPFNIVKIGLRRQRSNLFDRINKRVDIMMNEGFMDEAKRLFPKRNLNSLNTVGYKELFNVIDGQWELKMAVERIKKNTRVYAKKQMTWYAHDDEINWIDVDNMTTAQIIAQISDLLQINNKE